MGTVDHYPNLHAIVAGIHAHEATIQLPQPKPGEAPALKTMPFKKGKVFAVDRRGVRYIEQNLEKDSDAGERARNGATITWVIRTHRVVKDAAGKEFLVKLDGDDDWLGRVEDGQVWMK